MELHSQVWYTIIIMPTMAISSTTADKREEGIASTYDKAQHCFCNLYGSFFHSRKNVLQLLHIVGKYMEREIYVAIRILIAIAVLVHI